MSGHPVSVWRLPALILLCLAMLLPVQATVAAPNAGTLSPVVARQSDTTMWPPMIFAITCSVYADQFYSMEGIGFDLPEGCAFQAGASFTITDASGNFYGSCVTSGGGFCQGDVLVPVDVEVLVTQDAASIPAGYVVVDGNPQALTYPSSGMRGEGVPWLFVTMPAAIAGGQTGTPTETATQVVPATETMTAAPATGGVPSVRIEPGSDWIAYVGNDGNIWLMQPDGSQQTQVTTDGGTETGSSTYNTPVWSHDGTMLAFSRAVYGDAANGIWLLRDGYLTQVPNTDVCHAPAFSADDQRLLYACPQGVSVGDPVPVDLTTNPLRGYVTSSLLDGADQRIEVPYTIDDSGVKWTSESKSGYYVSRVDVRPSDGMIMVSYTGFHQAGVQWFAADGTLVDTFTMMDVDSQQLGPYTARFTPDGNAAIGIVCLSGCHAAADPRQFDIVNLDLQGNIVDRWLQMPPGQGVSGVDIAPDGSRVVTSIIGEDSTDATIVVLDGSMQPLAIGQGRNPAWQPNPMVKAGRPAETDPTPVPTDAPASTETPAIAPSHISGVWSGTGNQSPQGITWPIVLRVDDGAVGEVVGRVEYPSYGCVGELTLTLINGDGSIALRERIVEGLGVCVDGGTFTMWPGDGGSVTFSWIAPDGSSSATGTLAPVSQSGA